MGSGDIAVPSLQALLVSQNHRVLGVLTQPDRPAGRGLALHEPAPKRLALEAGITVLQPDRLRGSKGQAAREWLHAARADLFVVMAYGQILPPEVLALPRLGCINLHASLLPRHRGASPIQAAILAGDPTTGISVMFMDEGLDTGDVILKKEIAIGRRETGGSLHDRLARLAPEALMEALPLIEAGIAPRLKQDDALATHAPKLEKTAGRIAWTESAVQIERRIRAMNPWPGAFTVVRDAKGSEKLLKLHSAIVLRKTTGAPGDIISTEDRGIVVGTGSGAILLKSVQLEGRTKVTAAEFARGARLAPGAKFT